MELRFEIKPEGNYTNTLYTIRYFQYDGEGTLKLVDGPVLVNNDRVLLESKTFRLNYTAQSSDAHKFLVVVEDNFGSTPWEQTFEFNTKDDDDREHRWSGRDSHQSRNINPDQPMKKLLFFFVALLTLAAATPAHATKGA